MKRNLIVILAVLLSTSLYSQIVTFDTENFDGSKINYTSSSGWNADKDYYTSYPNAYLGEVPNLAGDIAVLTSPVYDLSNYKSVHLRFKHICKVSPQDLVRIEYKTRGTGWQTVSFSLYMGEATYGPNGFNTASYSEWQMNDSLALPEQSWWKEERFDVSGEVGQDDEVQFRFVVEKGNTSGTQIAYGWLLDDIKIIASPYYIRPPVVELVAPVISGQVYSTGPFTITARAEKQSPIDIEVPFLYYTVSCYGTYIAEDSILMEHVSGNNLWKAVIPQFPIGSVVSYSITAKDTIGNTTSISSSYIIRRPPNFHGIFSVALTSIDSPVKGQVLGDSLTPISVTIRNRGDSVLTSAIIHWSVNGVINSYNWSGNLPSDYEQQVFLGNYPARKDGYDTITVWVSMPNNIQDPFLTDDTLSIFRYGCAEDLAGVYTVGLGGDFSGIAEALDIFSHCAPAGDITLQLQSGVYYESWEIVNLSDFMGSHTLTITSLAGNKDSVILRPLSGAAITILNANNLRIEDITIDAASNGTYGIQFLSACTNVVITHCHILADTVETTEITAHAPVYKAANTGIANNVRISHNTINGGYYGVYFDGGYKMTLSASAQSGRDIIIDSNTVINAANTGIYGLNSEGSMSKNTIISRINNTNTNWIGMNFSDCKVSVTNNRIKQQNTDITSSFGIQFGNFMNNRSDSILIANNEIILYITQQNTAGIYISNVNTKMKIIHNSVYISGSGASCGIRGMGLNGFLVLRNNNIVMESVNAYPLYVLTLNIIGGGATNLQYDVDYNNLYAPNYIAYMGKDIYSMEAWQMSMPTDKHSIRALPDFINRTEHLQLRDFKNFLCNGIDSVSTDINLDTRAAITTMGCYDEFSQHTYNAAMLNIWMTNKWAGQTDTVRAIVCNMGDALIDTVNIAWVFNNTAQSNITLPVSLARGEVDTILLGVLTYPSSGGDVMLTAWISGLGSRTDGYTGDDTVTTSDYLCTGALAGGTYSVGLNGDFPTIQEALDYLKKCGTAGDIVFELQAGTHTEDIDLSDISNFMGNYTLTLTSAGGNAEEVILQAFATGITLSNSNNITIDALTIDASLATKAILFTGPCKNVSIRNCIMLLNATSATTGLAAIYKEASTGIADSIYIINNIINGGYYGIYFYGGDDTTRYGKGIVIDNNTIVNQFNAGIYTYYTDLTSISNNRIGSRTYPITTQSNLIWRGICLNYTNGPVTGNRIYNGTIGAPQSAIGLVGASSNNAILANFYNFYNTDKAGIIANNEIRLGSYERITVLSTAIPDGTRGIVLSNTHASILHNSIHIAGPGGGKGIVVLSGINSDALTVKNNNIVIGFPLTNVTNMRGARIGTLYSYPVYLASANYLHQYDMDYNNLYAPAYVGYVGGDITTIPDWQQTITTDLHSVSILPDFIDNTVNLKLSDYSDFHCLRYPEVNTDINGVFRSSITAMGAYHFIGLFNLALDKIIVDAEVVDKQRIPVSVNSMNISSETLIDSAVFGWSVNGTAQPPVSWRAGNPLTAGEAAEIYLGTFSAINSDTFKIKVWVENVNNILGTEQNKDTLSTTTVKVPLAHFVEPLIKDTLYNTPAFDVYVKIIEGTGSVIQTPQMAIQTITGGNTINSNVPMSFADGLWVAHIPQQNYYSRVVYSLTINDTVDNTLTITDSTYLQFIVNDSIIYLDYNLSILSIEKLVPDDVCSGDYAPIIITLANTGGYDYDFSVNPLTLTVEVTNPLSFYKDSILNTGNLRSGQHMIIELTDELPITAAGQYDVKACLNSNVDIVSEDDTLLMNYISGKFGLPVDENFSNGIPIDFNIKTNNTPYKWETITQSMGADTAVIPQFGTGMLAFKGTPGSMTALSTQQLDLSRTIQPALSFWYFHDTVPCKDYTDVRITIDGGATYNTLYSLKKYDASYGWKQYSADLPSYAVNQCVILVFEAMEKSRSGNVTQYIDRVRITAKRDVAVTEVFTSELSLCEMQNKEWKVVLSNLTDPVLNYANTPTDVILEIEGTSYTFTKSLQTGILGSFRSDTVILAPEFDFTAGRYNIKAYFTSVLDDNPANDTLRTSIEIKPEFAIDITKLSINNPALAGFEYEQKITITNTGNMELSSIGLVLSVTSDDGAYTFNARDTFNQTLQPNATADFTFNRAYTVPWSENYIVKIHGYLMCDSILFNKDVSVQEAVDMVDLKLVSIEKPADDGTIDVAGSLVEVEVNIQNLNPGTGYLTGDAKAGIMLTDTNGNPLQTLPLEELPSIGAGILNTSTITYPFNGKYTVPNLTEYYLVVYLDKTDQYNQNDTLKMHRSTNYVGLNDLSKVSFTMEQNIPNPAKGSTIINYSIPQDGKILFNIYSASGQLLYTKEKNLSAGKHQIKFNLSDYASGVYFYTMEYNGQRISKRMTVK